MSLKGVGKTISRAPQSFKQRFNIGDNTKDAVYIDAERRFAELEKETKKLHDESKKYFDAINGKHQHHPPGLRWASSDGFRNVKSPDRVLQGHPRNIQTNIRTSVGPQLHHSRRQPRRDPGL